MGSWDGSSQGAVCRACDALQHVSRDPHGGLQTLSGLELWICDRSAYLSRAPPSKVNQHMPQAICLRKTPRLLSGWLAGE
jgi:hypothetical protein